MLSIACLHPGRLSLTAAIINVLDIMRYLLRRLHIVGREGTEYLAEMATQAGYVWQSTLTAMNTAPLLDRPLRLQAVDFWLDFGEALGVEQLAADLTSIAPNEDDHTPQGCSWRECLCCDIQTFHVLRLCTGCGKAQYCNASCQKL